MLTKTKPLIYKNKQHAHSTHPLQLTVDSL